MSRGLISETQDFSSEAAATVCLEMAYCGPRYQDTSIGASESLIWAVEFMTHQGTT